MKPEGEVRQYQSGAMPYSVDAYIDSYHGPGWVKRRLRGRSGWLQVARAQLTTDVSDWTATLVAGITDDGEHLGKVASHAFIEMRTSGAQICYNDPPEELSELTEMLFWDFLGRCDLRHLAMLEHAESNLDARLTAEQARGEAVLADAERHIAELRRRRRSPEAPAEQRLEIDERIAKMEDSHGAASAWLVRHLAKLRDEGQAFEADIMAALENHGEYEELYTIHWVARSQYDRVVGRPLLRELTTTGSLHGVPRQKRLTKEDRWEIAEAQRIRVTPRAVIEPTRRRKSKPVDKLVRPRSPTKQLANTPADFPVVALSPTSAVLSAQKEPNDSDIVGALIESELAELLKDLRPK